MADDKPRCLYCGKVLRQQCDTVWETTDKWMDLPKRCTMGAYEECGGEIKKMGIDEEGRPWGECVKCGMDYTPHSRKRRIVERKPHEGLYGNGPGGYGDGFFCGQGCGLGFAVVAARSGIRLKDKGET